MLKKILLIGLLLPISLNGYKIGQFYKGRTAGDSFRFLGKVPRVVNGTFTLKAETVFKRIVMTYHPSRKWNEPKSPHRKTIFIYPRGGRIIRRFNLIWGKGKYHFSMWGYPGLDGKRSTFIGHFNVRNTTDRPTGLPSGSDPHQLSLEPEVKRIRRSTNGRIRVRGQTAASWLMIWVKKGVLRAISTLKIRGGKFDFPVHLRFGKGKYKIYFFTAGPKALHFRGQYVLKIRSMKRQDTRYTAPSPDIRSDNPAIRSLAARITRRKRHTLSRVKALYRWVTRNIRYDYKKLYSGRGGHRSAREVLKERKAVCTGYSFLFAALLRSQRIPVRIISGSARSRYFGNRWMPHAWVQVKVGRHWISADPTWDSSSPSRRGGRIRYRAWRNFNAPAWKFKRTHRLRKILYK